MTSNNELTVVLVERHLSDLCCEAILDFSYGFTSSSVPNLDISFACDEDFQAFLREECSTNCFVVGIFR